MLAGYFSSERLLSKVQNIQQTALGPPWAKIAHFYLQRSGTPLSHSFCTAPTPLNVVVIGTLVTARIICLSVPSVLS